MRLQQKDTKHLVSETLVEQFGLQLTTNLETLYSCSNAVLWLSQDLITVTCSITTVKHSISATVSSHFVYWLQIQQ